MYSTKTPFWLKALYPSLVWNKNREEKQVYLSFDDGPTPEITEWVLSQLKEFDAKATFFVIGKNVAEHPEIYQRILDDGHSVGNHTQNHLNGWNSSKPRYIENIAECKIHVDSNLFRPPYGRIKRAQIKELKKQYSIIMWDVLSADFDINLSADQCFDNVKRNVKNGSIIVFHDSVKAFPRLKEALPKTLAYLYANGYSFSKL